MASIKPIGLEDYGVSAARGFLPDKDPLTRLPSAFAAWDEAARMLPKWLISGTVRKHLAALPQLDPVGLDAEGDLNRAMLVLSYLGQSWVWGEREPSPRIPANIAVPWYEVARRLGRPPVLSYASHALSNWALLDQAQPIELGNIVRLENFLGGIDEDWFVLVHIAIEAAAPPAIRGAIAAQEAAAADRPERLRDALVEIANGLESMARILRRMPENCDPYIYYNRVRPFIFGWMANPALPEGVSYEGVDEWRDRPQSFRGETGAQSAIIPTIDAALGVRFPGGNPFHEHLMDLRNYMPPRHRALIETLEANDENVNIRGYISDRAESNNALIEKYDACIEHLHAFRKLHLDFARLYIHKQAQTKDSNPVEAGTGGTPFMTYLRQHCEDVLAHRLARQGGPTDGAAIRDQGLVTP